MRNKDIAAKFKLLAGLMELHGDNPFKIRSYENAARTIEQQPATLNSMSEAELEDIPGIGKAIASKIISLLHTGSFDLMDKLLQTTPAGVVEMLRIKGLGPKKVKSIWKELEVDTVGELLYACEENRLLRLKGFGEKVQETIRKSIEYYLANAKRYRYGDIETEAMQICESFAKLPEVGQVMLTGQFRRRCEVIDQVELLIEGNWNRLEDWCQTLGLTLISEDENAAHLQTAAGIPLILYRMNSKESASYQLLKTTATHTHWEQLVAIGPPNKKATTEFGVYQSLGLQYIETELREGLGEVEKAKNGRIPELLSIEDITGIIHAHSTYSDGRDSLEVMAQACKDLGYRYLGITDHSKAAFYANGLSEQDIIRQHEEIDQLNLTLAPFKIFKGIEADILSDGSLDYNDDVLNSFDFVIASVHSNLNMDEEKANRRLLKAIENPHTVILGHMTGRLLLTRAGYPVNHHKIIDACAANKVVIEINANPYRLDIDWRWIPYCLEKGVLLSVNPDAHNTQGLGHVKYGVYAARKGGLHKTFTLNTRNVEQVALALSKKW
ncbi:MAG: DNA polymerase/3'-5' exonuclease PolX [Sphingobacteriales bacterium]|nr:MAG: DNA polymerase/3'-5' exonuclease PolX [Sphingobacteriales bacterium]